MIYYRVKRVEIKTKIQKCLTNVSLSLFQIININYFDLAQTQIILYEPPEKWNTIHVS